MTSHIAIIGSALSGNKGAAAMLESSISTLTDRLGDVQFTLFSMYPDEDSAQNTYPNLRVLDARPVKLGVVINSLALAYRLLPPMRGLLRRRSASIAALSQADVLLDQGGITFTDGREKFLLYNVASILPALNTRTPVFKCAQAVGPFTNPINRRVSRIFLPKVRTIVSRGHITHGLALGLGLTNVVEGADYAFALPAPDTVSAEAAYEIPETFFDGADVVGISPSVVVQKKVAARGADYVEILVAFVAAQRAAGRRVLILPHSARTSTDKTHNNDLPLCRTLAARFEGDSGVFVIQTELSSQDLRHYIGRCTYFVASRFHAMVSALAMGVPTLVIGWGHKYEEVLAMFGLEQWALPHGDLAVERLDADFRELVGAESDVRAALSTHLPDVVARSVSQADLISGIVLNRHRQ